MVTFCASGCRRCGAGWNWRWKGTIVAYGSYIIVKALVLGDSVLGFPSLIAVITFLGGIQLLTMGIMGEYLGRMFDEAKQRRAGRRVDRTSVGGGGALAWPASFSTR
jgi:glycosyltransferase involved in cell wall biosynthesis